LCNYDHCNSNFLMFLCWKNNLRYILFEKFLNPFGVILQICGNTAHLGGALNSWKCCCSVLSILAVFTCFSLVFGQRSLPHNVVFVNCRLEDLQCSPVCNSFLENVICRCVLSTGRKFTSWTVLHNKYNDKLVVDWVINFF